jgi:hypothetical protein
LPSQCCCRLQTAGLLLGKSVGAGVAVGAARQVLLSESEREGAREGREEGREGEGEGGRGRERVVKWEVLCIMYVCYGMMLMS